MSLFPAFAGDNSDGNKQEETSDTNWLTNSSFQVDFLHLITTPATNDKPTKTIGKRKDESQGAKTKKSKSHKKDDDPINLGTTSEVFRIDKKPTKEFFTVNTISRPSVARYEATYSTFKRYKSKNRKFVRYFKMKLDIDKEVKDNVIKKGDLDKKIIVAKGGNCSGFNEEQNLTKTTEEFNRKLAENPQDVQTWLEYARFQDTVYAFEKNYKKGSIAKGNRVTADRKLSILDKALSHLPNNEAVLRERLNVCVNTFPSDELYVHLGKLVEKERSNIILWQGYIESRQCSMSHCNTPTVLKLYTKCLSTLHQLRRTAKIEKSVLEENILRMLYQCGLFLKQSGLFELLWTLLRMYLDLNLSHSEKNNMFMTSSMSNEQELMKLEETVLSSQLPLHELWLRTEKLREACHWIPYVGEDNCGDPQRLVFAEDVAELIHPITMPGNTFKMTATILTLLKVPLLPCRHTTMKNFGLDYVPWALDSIETILPIFLQPHFIDLSSQHFLNYTQKLTVGPQYLKPFPGQEEYLIFILEIMSKCIESLNGTERTAISVWVLRFHRTLCILEKKGLVKMTKELQKKLKSDRKNLLKTSGNNIALYIEYSLIENDLNDNPESAMNILMTTLKTQQTRRPIDILSDQYLKASLCSTFKTLIELYFKQNKREKTLEFTLRLALGINLDRNIEISENSVSEATLKFKHVTLKILQANSDVPNVNITQTVEHFLPNFLVDWISCHLIFMYYTKGIQETIKFFEEQVLIHLHESKLFENEILHEFYVSLLFNECLKDRSVLNVKTLENVLYKSIKTYPNNIFFLAVLSKVENISCSVGKNFWKLKSLLMGTEQALPSLFLVLMEMERANIIKDTWVDTCTGAQMSMDSGLKNKTLALFRSLVGPGMCTRRCGLIWRLYLQFLYYNYDPKLCRNAYYTAVEECPWLKALYIDAAVYIPAELPQIQDLLIEKQLRLHVTPDELDILRNQ